MNINTSPNLLDRVEHYANQKNVVTSNENYKIYAPPRDRQDGKRVTWKPQSLDDFESIKLLDEQQKRDIGLQVWGEFVKRDGRFYSIEDFEGQPMIFTDKGRVDLSSEEISASKHVLWLFPKELYSSIPDGLEIVDINGSVEKFERNKSDNDSRFGALAYGIAVKKI